MFGLLDSIKIAAGLVFGVVLYYYLFFVPDKLETLKKEVTDERVKVERTHKIEMFELNSSISIEEMKRSGYEKISDDLGVHHITFDSVQ